RRRRDRLGPVPPERNPARLHQPQDSREIGLREDAVLRFSRVLRSPPPRPQRSLSSSGRAAGGDGRTPPEYGDFSRRCRRPPALRSVAAVRALPGQPPSSVACAPQLAAASGLEQTVDAADPKD